MSESALVVGAVALLLVGSGVGIARGRLRLLSNYEPGAVTNERRVARLAGGAIIGYGVVTGLFAVRLRSGAVADGWWLGWILLTVAVAFGVTAVASGRA